MIWRDRVRATLYSVAQAAVPGVDVAWGAPSAPREDITDEVIARYQWLGEVTASATRRAGGVVEPPHVVTMTCTAAAGDVIAFKAGGVRAQVVATGVPATDALALAAEVTAWLDAVAVASGGDVVITGDAPDSLLSPMAIGGTLAVSLSWGEYLERSVRYLASVTCEVFARGAATDARDALGNIERALASESGSEAAYRAGVYLRDIGTQRADLSAFLSGGAWETRAVSTIVVERISTHLEPISTITTVQVSPQVNT